MDAGNILKPALARGELHIVGATTLDEYRQSIEKDAALERRFQPCWSRSRRSRTRVAILHGLRDRYEAHHQVRFTDEALAAAAELSERYVTDRFLPDKAIDLVDQAGARKRLRAKGPHTDSRELERRLESLQRDKDQAVADEDYERAGAAARRDRGGPAAARGGPRRPPLRAGRRARGDRRGHRRGRLALDRHPGHASSPRPSGTACSGSRSSCTSGSSARTTRSRRSPRPCAARGPGWVTRTVRSAASCSSARPASARPSWPRPWPRRCSATRTAWSAST